MKKQNIEKLRFEIDQLDEKIIKLISDRLGKVREIGEIKTKQNISKLDTKRFNELLKNRIEYAKKHGLSKNLITRIWHLIHDEALRIEKNIK